MFWEDRDKYFRGTLKRRIRNKQNTFVVLYEDGDCYDVNFDHFEWKPVDQRAVGGEISDVEDGLLTSGNSSKYSEMSALPRRGSRLKSLHLRLWTDIQASDEKPYDENTYSHRYKNSRDSAAPTSRTSSVSAHVSATGTSWEGPSEPSDHRDVNERVQKRRGSTKAKRIGPRSANMSASGGSVVANSIRKHHWKKRVLRDYLSTKNTHVRPELA